MLRFLKDFLRGTSYSYCPHCNQLHIIINPNAECEDCQGGVIVLQPYDDYNPEVIKQAYNSLDFKKISEITDNLKEKYYVGDRQLLGDKIRMDRHDKIQKQWNDRQPQTIKCPNCQSSSVEKIGVIERGSSIAFLGIASGKIGKNFKCKSCGNIW